MKPIELIWGKVNNNHSLKRIEEITKIAIETVSAEDWKNCVRHRRQIEDEYRRKDRIFDHLMENFLVNIEGDGTDPDNDEYMDEIM